MFERVPEGWKQVRLAEIATISMGETLLSKNLTGQGIPVFSANTDDGPWGYTDQNRKTLRRGAIVVGARGSIGFPRLPAFDAFTCTQTTISVEPDPSQANSVFLHNALRSTDIKGMSAQQAVPMLTIGMLGPVTVLLPPLDEQRRIAEVLRSVDDAIADAYALRLAADDLLTRYRREILGPLVTNPDGTSSLGNLCELGRGFAFKSQDYTNEGILNFRVTNVGRQELDIGEMKFLPKSYLSHYADYRLYGDEIVLVMVGATVGKLGRVPAGLCPALLNQNMWTLTPKPNISRDLLWHLAHILIEEKVHSAQGGAYSFLTKKDFLRHGISSFNPEALMPHIDAMSAVEAYSSRIAEEEVALAVTRRLIATDLLTGRIRVPA